MEARNMEQYHWYDITYQIPGIDRKPKHMTATFLGLTRPDGPATECSFNLRPLAGTSAVRIEYIINVEPAMVEKVKLPHIVRSGEEK